MGNDLTTLVGFNGSAAQLAVVMQAIRGISESQQFFHIPASYLSYSVTANRLKADT